MTAAHRVRRVRQDSEGDWIGVCACGWESDTRPLAELAQALVESHVESHAEASASPEAEAILGRLEKALASPRRGALRLELTAEEARFLRRLLRG